MVRLPRDDRVATVEMDYNASNAWGQFWTMSGAPDDDAGFLVAWWPQVTTLAERTAFIANGDCGGLCLSPDGAAALASSTTRKLATSATSSAAPFAATSATTAGLANLPVGANGLVTGSRRVQLQPLDNTRAYPVRVERLSARSGINSRAAELGSNGGDGTRVAALRSALTSFDDFNLPLGPADEKLWNNASAVSTDRRFNLFFVNDQFHAHTLHGTRADNTRDRSQTSQRFHAKVRIESA